MLRYVAFAIVSVLCYGGLWALICRYGHLADDLVWAFFDAVEIQMKPVLKAFREHKKRKAAHTGEERKGGEK